MAEYKPPKSGILAHLPSSWVPYAELCRLVKPTGTLNITLPYVLGFLFNACVVGNSLYAVAMRLTVLLVAGFLLRGAGCSWNDIIDREVDKHVERCRLRPMARGALSVPSALAFTIVQFVVWLAVLSTLVPRHWPLTAPLILMVLSYPFAKRYTHYAQVVLGVTLAWGTLIGSNATGVNILIWNKQPLELGSTHNVVYGQIGLFLSYVVWSVLHDTVYAQQDIKDDLKTNLMSVAVHYKHQLRMLLAGLSIVQVVLHVWTGICLQAGVWYYLPACLGCAAMLFTLVTKLDLEDPSDCAWWFNNGSAWYGGLTFLGLFAEYMSR